MENSINGSKNKLVYFNFSSTGSKSSRTKKKVTFNNNNRTVYFNRPSTAPSTSPLTSTSTSLSTSPLPVPLPAPSNLPLTSPLPVPLPAPSTSPLPVPLPAPLPAPLTSPLPVPLPAPSTAPSNLPSTAPLPVPTKSLNRLSKTLKAKSVVPSVTSHTLKPGKNENDLRNYLFNVTLDNMSSSPKPDVPKIRHKGINKLKLEEINFNNTIPSNDVIEKSITYLVEYIKYYNNCNMNGVFVFLNEYKSRREKKQFDNININLVDEKDFPIFKDYIDYLKQIKEKNKINDVINYNQEYLNNRNKTFSFNNDFLLLISLYILMHEYPIFFNMLLQTIYFNCNTIKETMDDPKTLVFLHLVNKTSQ